MHTLYVITRENVLTVCGVRFVLGDCRSAAAVFGNTVIATI